MTDLEEYGYPQPAMTDRGESDADVCDATYGPGPDWWCTRKARHEGRHEAGIFMAKFASWGDPS